MIQQYIHQSVSETESIDDWEEMVREKKIEFSDKELLYVIGSYAAASTGCNCGSPFYISVPGYISSWKSSKDDKGRWITEVEPITDERSKDEIWELLYHKEGIVDVQFP